MHDSLIYKPGEGYWIRVMTLAMVAIVTLTSAAWAYKSLEVLSDRIPAKSWNLVVRGFQGTAAPGQQVVLLSNKGSTTGEPVQFGTTQVISQASSGGGESVVEVAPPSIAGTQSIQDVENQTIKIGDASVLVANVRAVPAFDIEYAQIAAAGIIIVAGAWCAFWFVGRNHRSVEFLIATDAEMRKVNWSTRREILGSTYVVIGACLLVALSLFLIDYAFSHVFIAIDLLRLGK